MEDFETQKTMTYENISGMLWCCKEEADQA